MQLVAAIIALARSKIKLPQNPSRCVVVDIELVRVAHEQKSALENLYQFYEYEFTAYTNANVEPNGLYVIGISQYWEDPRWNPFFIIATGEIAGFVVVLFENMDTDPDPTHANWDLFVMKKHRRKNVGSHVATQAFNMYRADWKVAQMKTNLPAIAFWRKAISRFTQGQFTEQYRDDLGKFI